MPRDLFSPVVSSNKMHPLFQAVRQDASHEAGRQMVNAVFADFQDVDKSFVKEFQTGGFSARIFELALFAYLQEQDLPIDRSQVAPDFVVRGDTPVAVEVTTTNPPQNAEPDDDVAMSLVPEDLTAADQAFVFQLGKALRRKLKHQDAKGRSYWERPHVTDVPFVIAVGAFHDRHAQWHPLGLVGEYLYGKRDRVDYDADGDLVVTTEQIIEHEWGGTTIPSGLFGQPEAANLAGVLFSNAHTVSIFDRIGTELGLGSSSVAMCRTGTCYDPDPHAAQAQPFAYVVGDRPIGEEETFSEGLVLFLNPWATTPLSPLALPNITYLELLDNGTVRTSHYGGLQPFVSRTFICEGEQAEAYARYLQLSYLGLVHD